MKSKILFLISMLAVLFSCSDDEPTVLPPYLDVKLEADTVVFSKDNSFYDVKVEANGPFSARLEEECDWCHVTWDDGLRGFLRVRVDFNRFPDERWATVVVNSEGLSKSFRVMQFGLKARIMPVPASLEGLTYEPSEFQLRVYSNVDFDASLPDSADWVVIQKELVRDTMRILYFRTEVNEYVTPRETALTLRQKDGEMLTKEVRISQIGRPDGFEPVDPKKLPEDIKLQVTSATDDSHHEDNTAARLIDGDMNTMYHSNWSKAVGYGQPVNLEFTLAQTKQLDYMVYYPRQTGNDNGNFGKIVVYYSTRDDENYVLLDSFDFKGLSRVAQKVDFGGVKNPYKVKVVVNTGTNNNAAGTEMQFMRKSDGTVNLDRALSEIFSDGTCSELRDGVTYDQIMTIEDEFIRNIARHLYFGTYPIADRVKEYEIYQDPGWIERTYKISPYDQLDNATGIYIDSMDYVRVFCGEIPEGLSVMFQVFDWASGNYTGSNAVKLTEGLNDFTVTKSGLAYVKYFQSGTMEEIANTPPVKVHVATGKVNGLFRKDVNTDEEWQDILDKTTYSFMDLLGNRTHMVMRVEDYRSYVTSPTLLCQAYDTLLYLENELMGLFKYNRPIKNRMMYEAVNHNFMYATSYRTAYNYSTMSTVLNADEILKGAWGPGHEVGHCNQTRPGMKWQGMTEVTNNIYALYVQTTLGEKSRVIREGREGSADMMGWNRYEQAYRNIIIAEMPHAAVNQNLVFNMLVPFWQMQLYSTRIAPVEGVDLYPDILEEVRNETNPTGETAQGQCQVNYAVRCSRLLKADLSDYFEKWGFLREINQIVGDYSDVLVKVTKEMIDKAKNEMSQYPKPELDDTLMLYINDENCELLKNKTPMTEGTVRGEKSGSTYKIYFEGWSNVIAYEFVYNLNGTWKMLQVGQPPTWAGQGMILDNSVVTEIESVSGAASFDWKKARIRARGADGKTKWVEIKTS